MNGSKREVILEQRNGHCASNETIHKVEMALEEGILFKEDVVF